VPLKLPVIPQPTLLHRFHQAQEMAARSDMLGRRDILRHGVLPKHFQSEFRGQYIQFMSTLNLLFERPHTQFISQKQTKLTFPLKLRNRPPHELIKQRNGKCHVAVGWAVDHPFFDQLGPDRPEAVNLDPKHCSNISGSIGIWTQMGHGSQIIFLTGG